MWGGAREQMQCSMSLFREDVYGCIYSVLIHHPGRIVSMSWKKFYQGTKGFRRQERVIQKPPEGVGVESRPGESEAEQTHKQSDTRTASSLIGLAGGLQRVVWLKGSSCCWSAGDRGTAGLPGPSGKPYLICLLPRVWNLLQFLPDSTRGRNVHAQI